MRIWSPGYLGSKPLHICQRYLSRDNPFKFELDFLLKSDVSILVIPSMIDKSYLHSGDRISQTSPTINAPNNQYVSYAAYAVVNGELHIFGGYNAANKVLFCLTNKNYEI